MHDTSTIYLMTMMIQATGKIKIKNESASHSFASDNNNHPSIPQNYEETTPSTHPPNEPTVVLILSSFLAFGSEHWTCHFIFFPHHHHYFHLFLPAVLYLSQLLLFLLNRQYANLASHLPHPAYNLLQLCRVLWHKLQHLFHLRASSFHGGAIRLGN
jgi:hypothetical protein